MDDATRAWLISQLGTATDLNDLDQRYTRLGTARAVAIEVLYERKAALVMGQPASVNVSSVVSVSYTENIKALERQIAALEAGDPPAPDDPTDGISSTRFDVIQLRERPRR
ncbi:hypothetical protein ACFV4E_22380 [Streptomyces hygroscopicus]|uniref:Uncharacterized protein n=1 Tax=Streptomyces hygroscopicus TaxID=1912 RepID=A0ABQ3UGD1_STRHY|nr:hypothetical protein [Streptomyces hygroscopicus]GHJ34343.1 hypothetical protein TPA0910_87760 [Streptomyces hygroscopicus]